MSRNKKIRILEAKIIEGFNTHETMNLLELCKYIGSTNNPPKNLKLVEFLLGRLQERNEIFYDQTSGHYYIPNS